MLRILVAAAMLTAAALPAAAQTVDELKAELEAQKTINALLKQRVETLEGQLARFDPGAGSGIPAPYSDPPPDAQLDADEERALERAFERRGLSVLPPKMVEITPSLSWSHSGRNLDFDTIDFYAASTSLRVGLPGNFMVGASLPYVIVDSQRGGTDGDLGNLSLTAWKGLVNQSDSTPRVVARIGTSLPIDDDDGLYSVTGGLSVSKSIDPIAFFGSASYTHTFDRTINGFKQERAGLIGVGFGAGLAVTPDISMTTSFDLSYQDEIKINGTKIPGTEITAGIFSLGAGFVLSKDVFLSISGGFGITDDSPDAVLSASLPMRF